MSRGQAGDGEGTKTPGRSGDGGNRTKGGRGGQQLEGEQGQKRGLVWGGQSMSAERR